MPIPRPNAAHRLRVDVAAERYADHPVGGDVGEGSNELGLSIANCLRASAETSRNRRREWTTDRAIE